LQFDVDAALKDGYSEGQLADYLGGLHGYDVGKMRADGYADSAILGFLRPLHLPEAKSTPSSPESFDDTGMLRDQASASPASPAPKPADPFNAETLRGASNSGVYQMTSGILDSLWAMGRDADMNPALAFDDPIVRGLKEGARLLMPKDEQGRVKRAELAAQLEDAAEAQAPALMKKSFDEASEQGQIIPWMLTQTSGQSGNIAVTLASILFPPLAPAALPLMGVSSGGNQYAEDVKDGVDHAHAMADATVNAVAEMADEVFSFGVGKVSGKLLSKALEKVPMEMREAAASTLLGRVGKAVGVLGTGASLEGASEVLTGVAQDVSQEQIAGRDAGDMAANARTNFMASLIPGAVFSSREAAHTLRPTASKVQLTGDLKADLRAIAEAPVTPIAQPSSTTPAIPPQAAIPAPVVAGEAGATGQDAVAVAVPSDVPSAVVQQADDIMRASDSKPFGSKTAAELEAADRGLTDYEAVPIGDEVEGFVLRKKIDAAAARAATSPDNNLPEPTEAQKKAGNYQLGHTTLHGLDLSIENPRGSTRSGVDADGKEWSVEMAHHYGYIKGSTGRDKDHVDVFVGPNPASKKVFVVDQVNADGSFDEHKVMMGFDSQAEADAGYHANYAKGWTGRGAITEMSVDEFKQWVRDPKATRAPLSDAPLSSSTNADATITPAASTDAASAPQPEVENHVEQAQRDPRDVTAVNVLNQSLTQGGVGRVTLAAAQAESAGADGLPDSPAGTARLLGEVLGKRVVAVEAEDGSTLPFNGVVLKKALPRHIFIDAKANVAPIVVVGHEVIHHIRQQFPEVYDRFVKAITPHVDGQAHLADFRANNKDDGAQAMSADKVFEELASDLGGNRLTERSTWRKLAERSPGAFREFASKVIEYFDHLIGRAKKVKGADEYVVGDMERVRDALVDMLAEYSAHTEKETHGKEQAASAARAEGLQDEGAVRGGDGSLADDGRTYSRNGRALEGAPTQVDVPGRGKVFFGIHQPAVEAARAYAKKAGLPFVQQTTYAKVNKERAARIADEYERMEHAPADPKVKAAYDAMIAETTAQYEAVLATGLKVEFIDFEKQGDPYAASPRLAILDVIENNHLWVFSTRDGFGTSEVDVSTNPLLAETSHKISGKPALANDLFRVVHDYFGHIENGVGFRADGEENAWRSHSTMYTPLARRAMTSETRGQNSWLNFGPQGEKNRTASSAETVYADQKTGLLPDWVSEDGAFDASFSRKHGDEDGRDHEAAVDGADRADQDVLATVGGGRPAQGWAGATRIAGKSGQPVRVFRGATRALGTSDFQDQALGVASGNPSSGLGVWFTSGEGEASGYGEVHSHFLDIRKPKLIKVDELPGFDTTEDAIAFRKQLQAQGFDGIIITARHLGKNELHFVAFAPAQVIVENDSLDFTLSRKREGDVISTRNPTGKRSQERALDSMLEIGLDAMKMDRDGFEHNVSLLMSYPGVKKTGARTNDAKAERFIDHVVGNLLWLHDQMTPELRNRAKLWYDGANKIARTFARDYGITKRQASGMLAALSPQKDWFQNVSLAKRVAETMAQHQKTKWTAEMTAAADRLQSGSSPTVKGKPTTAQLNDHLVKLFGKIRGKTLAEVSDLVEQAAWVRIFDEAHNARSYPVVTPEGENAGLALNKSGSATKVAWGDFGTIANAISIFRNGSVENISNTLGMEHKVRSFYNNIVDPTSDEGHVTIDTHAVAAGLARPLAGGSREVLHNFGNNITGEPGPASSKVYGTSGVYGFYAEAYRRAAAERGLLPREMQSITWEAVRGLFKPEFKRAEIAQAKANETLPKKDRVDTIDSIWENYARGNLTLEQARSQVLKAAGGISVPEWAGGQPAGEVDEGERRAGDAGSVPAAGVPGRDAAVDGGAGSAAARESAAAVPEELTLSRKPDFNPDLPRGTVLPMTKAEESILEEMNKARVALGDAWDAARERLKAEEVKRMRASARENLVPDQEKLIDTLASYIAGERLLKEGLDDADYRAASQHLRELEQRRAEMVSQRVGPPEFVGMRQLKDFHRPQVETPEFKAWFADSKVTDEDGRPLIAFHGTHEDISAFKTVQDRKHSDVGNNWLGQLGAWFAAPPKGENVNYDPGNAEFTAGEFASLRSDDEGGVIYPVFLSIQHPYEWDGGYEELARYRDEVGGGKKFREMLIRDGFDGLVLRDSDTDGGQIRDDWVAFYPEQIKSAIGNVGFFERAQPELAFSRKVTDTPEFKAWFGNSKIVDSGEPLRVYHITRGDHETLKPGGNDPSMSGPAIWVGTDPTMQPAAHNVGGFGGVFKEGTNVRPLYARVESPLYIDDDSEMPGLRKRLKLSALFPQAVTPQDVANVKAAGHDGVVYETANGQEIAVFDEDQLRSAITPEAPNFARKMRERVTEGVKDHLEAALNSKRTFGVWDRTVGTQINKARKSPEFKRVFDKANEFIRDISYFASTAADEAPTLLPKLESITSLGKGLMGTMTGKRQAQLREAAQVVYEGTLAKTVYSDAELSKRGVSPEARTFYAEARRAVDTSLEQTATSIMARMARSMRLGVEGVRGMSMMQARVEIVQTLKAKRDSLGAELANEQQLLSLKTEEFGKELTPEALAATLAKVTEKVTGLQRRYDELVKAIDDVNDVVGRVTDLQNDGYFPLMRFGDYTVYATEKMPDGEVKQLYFGMFETEAERVKMERTLRQMYPTATVKGGVANDEYHQLFAGINLDSLEVFAEAMGASEQAVFQSYLKLAVANRSALKRMIERKEVDGFNNDLTRTLAHFVTSNARLASRNYHWAEAKAAVTAIPKERGDVQKEAVRLLGFIENPNEEAQALRAMNFLWFMAGNISTAILNLTQPAMTTFPYLSRYGVGAAQLALAKGAKTLTGKGIDAELAAALKLAKEKGVTAPHEIHNLYGEQQRTVLSRDTRLGAIFQRGTRLIGEPFALAEAFNRHVTFVAAFEVGRKLTPEQLKKEGVDNAFGFAMKAVDDTQFVYNKANRPNWARGSIQSLVFQFKNYSISSVELFSHLAKQGPEGKRAAALMLAMWMLAAGFMGMPYEEDIEDLLDTLGQTIGFDTNVRASMRDGFFKGAKAIFGDKLGPYAAELVMHGASGVLPLDVQARLSFSNLIPATGVAKRSAADNRGKELSELLGPSGGLINSMFEAVDSFQRGEGAPSITLPSFARNAAQALDMLQTGVYRDAKGATVVKTDKLDAAIKLLGFQPSDVAQKQRQLSVIGEQVKLQKVAEKDFAERAAQALTRAALVDTPEASAKAERELEDVMAGVAKWNERNPDTPVVVTGQQIRSRVKQMMMEREQRVLKSAPREMRGIIARELGED
jgi:hypothetical protein